MGPSHPYTIGLLRSLPRLDRPRQRALTPIEGSPPDLAADLIGCPFAPRCAWRTDDSWLTNPPLQLARNSRATPGPLGGHFVACHNQPTPEEAVAGHPVREGFMPAPPPGAIRAAIEQVAEPSIGEELVVFGPDGTSETLSSPGAIEAAEAPPTEATEEEAR
jgi:oligopeptide/dipeptide ABC transporter ATP-binding protein